MISRKNKRNNGEWRRETNALLFLMICCPLVFFTLGGRTFSQKVRDDGRRCPIRKMILQTRRTENQRFSITGTNYSTRGEEVLPQSFRRVRQRVP
jgi:hypothetical protein